MDKSVLFTLDTDQQVLLAALLAIVMSENLNANELNILGNFIEVLGQNILLIQAIVAAAPPVKKPASISNASKPNTDQDLEQEIKTIKARLHSLEEKYTKTH